MRSGFRRILAYWRAERRTIRQGFTALIIADLGSLIGGIALGSITHTLEALPGLLVLIPAAIGMRGNIFGALASRLGTTIHSGLFETGRSRTGVLYQNFFAVSVLTLAISLLLGFLAKVLSEAFGIRSISMLDFAVISILGGILSSLIVGVFTVGLSIRAHRRGWDLDSVAAPLVTAAGDLVTIPSLWLATFAIRVEWVTPVVAGVAALGTLALSVRGLTSDLATTRRILRESLPILALAGLVDLFAGLVMEARIDQFVALPALIIMVPPFLESAGALGGILTARLASKLHLGVISPRGRPEPVALLDASIILLFAVRSFAVTAVVTHLAATVVGLRSPGLLPLLEASLIGGAIATVAAVVVGYYAAVATYRLGLDPDNHGIPIITSTMDFIGVMALVIGLLAAGIGR